MWFGSLVPLPCRHLHRAASQHGCQLPSELSKREREKEPGWKPLSFYSIILEVTSVTFSFCFFLFFSCDQVSLCCPVTRSWLTAASTSQTQTSLPSQPSAFQVAGRELSPFLPSPLLSPLFLPIICGVFDVVCGEWVWITSKVLSRDQRSCPRPGEPLDACCWHICKGRIAGT